MRYYILLFVAFLSLYSCLQDKPWKFFDEEVSVLKIFSKECMHSAFTDFAFFNGKFYCTFRVAKKHVGDDEVVYLLTRKNSKNWKVVRSFRVEGVDLRDPKFVISEDLEIFYLHIGGSIFNNGEFVTHKQFVTESQNGKDWQILNLINIKDKWLWKPIIHYSSALALGHTAGDELVLYKSSDLINYHIENTIKSDPTGILTEVAFDKSNDSLFAIVRKNYPESYFGISKNPFHEWKWIHLDEYLVGLT